MTNIYAVIEGPILLNDYDDEWAAEDDGWVLICITEADDGSLYEEDILFDTLEEAMEVVEFFKAQIIPFSVDVD